MSSDMECYDDDEFIMPLPEVTVRPIMFKEEVDKLIAEIEAWRRVYENYIEEIRNRSMIREPILDHVNPEVTKIIEDWVERTR